MIRHPAIRSPWSSVLVVAADGRDTDTVARRNRDLKRVDRELWRGNEKGAVKIVKRLQGTNLRGFGAAKQVLFKNQSLDDDGVNPRNTTVVDSVHQLVMKIIQSVIEEKPLPEMMDNPVYSETDRLSCAQHEAGHFLVAYLLGVLPRRYLVPSINEAGEPPSYNAFVELVDFASPFEDNISGCSKALPRDLNMFCCIALGGILATYPDGVDQGFLTDIFKVYGSVDWMEFTETEAENYMRWVILTTYQILKPHRLAALELANAMAKGRPVGHCIGVIEDFLSEV